MRVKPKTLASSLTWYSPEGLGSCFFALLVSVNYSVEKSIIATIEAICQEVANKETPFCICTSATGSLLKMASRILKNVHVTHVDLCMFGCERKRRVVLGHNVAPLHNLGVTCDGDHQHRPWTAEAPPEADPRWLPEKFCKSLCNIMTPLLTRARLPRRMPTSLESTSKGASRWPALVPEFKAIVRAHSVEQRQNLQECLSVVSPLGCPTSHPTTSGQ